MIDVTESDGEYEGDTPPQIPWFDMQRLVDPCYHCRIGVVAPIKYVPCNCDVDPFEYDYLEWACKTCGYAFKTRTACWGPYVRHKEESENREEWQ